MAHLGRIAAVVRLDRVLAHDDIMDIGRTRPFAIGKQTVPGVFRTDWGGIVCDLRRAKPGTALRPHAQHGFLIRSPARTKLWDRSLMRVYFDVRAARSWLGEAGSLNREGLFPSPQWDEMYRSLLSPGCSTFFDAKRAAGFDIGSPTMYDFH
jgi:hypothetical protein